MALPSGNRKQWLYAIRPGLAKVLGKAVIASDGEVTQASSDLKEFTVTKASTGTYTLTLNSPALGLIGCNVSLLRAGVDGYMTKLVSEAVTTTGVVTIGVVDNAGAAVDPDSSTMFIELTVKTSEQS